MWLEEQMWLSGYGNGAVTWQTRIWFLLLLQWVIIGIMESMWLLPVSPCRNLHVCMIGFCTELIGSCVAQLVRVCGRCKNGLPGAPALWLCTVCGLLPENLPVPRWVIVPNLITLRQMVWAYILYKIIACSTCHVDGVLKTDFSQSHWTCLSVEREN